MGRSVAVLDQNRPRLLAPHRRQHRTLDVCVDASYLQLRGQFSEGGARLAAQSSMAAIDFIERTVTELAITCDFERVPRFHFCQDLAAAQQLEHEAGLTQSLGLAMSFESKASLPLPVKGAVRFADQAQFDAPRYYCLAIALELAGTVYGDTRVESAADSEPCALRAAGHTEAAQTLVMATHVPRWGPSALLGKLTGHVSNTMAFELRAGALDPYHYIRRVRDRGRNLLLIGGADPPTHGATASEARFQQLEAYARRHFELAEMAYRGSGEYFDAVDNLQYIGRVPGASHMPVGTGYARTGLTFGTVAGLLLADLVLGHADDCADLYWWPSRPAPAPVARAASARQVRR